MMKESSKPRARFQDPLLFLFRAKTRIYTMWLSAIYPFASRGRNLTIQYPCRIDRRLANQIKLGNSVVINKDGWLNVQSESSDEVKIIIDDNCAIGAGAVISAKNCIHIERNVIMATSVLLQEHNHAYEAVSLPIRAQGETPGGRIRICEGCWIGKGSAIVCNEGELVIGRNSVIGANSLVTRSVPPYSVVVGNPGRVAKQYDPVKRVWVMGSIRSIEVDLTK
jgi:acetyltransferase-like isoleucine patch superfamily enzyme